jgi:hypothetical protein
VTGQDSIILQVWRHRSSKRASNINVVLALLLFFAARPAKPVTYDVGPAQAYVTVGQVPWSSLGPGDTVRIHYQPTPYREKILVSSRGTPGQHIQIIGVPGPNGELPEIRGDNATTGSNMQYRWTNPEYQQKVGIFQIGYRTLGPKPGYIDVANLKVTGSHPFNRFTAQDGSIYNYSSAACGIHIYGGEHLRFTNMVISDNENGFFAKSDAAEDFVSRDIVLENSRIYGNGTPGSDRHHNVYTESDGVVIQGNQFGMLVSGAFGTIIKDRSAGTVVRYNWIPTGSRMLDLVEPADSAPILGVLATYKQTFVYGNVFTTDGADPFVMTKAIHYGGDQGTGTERNGTLYFYNNTFVIHRNQKDGWKVLLFDVTLNSATVDIRNNIFVNASRTGVSVVEMDFSAGTGVFNFGPNWVSPGWKMSFSGSAPFRGTYSGTGQFISPQSNDPGFINLSEADYHLTANSSVVNVARSLAPAVYENATNQNYDVLMQYSALTSIQSRRSARIDNDLGAFQAATVSRPAVPVALTNPVTTQVPNPLPPADPILPSPNAALDGLPYQVVVQSGANGYSGTLAKTISDLYAKQSWNQGTGYTLADGERIELFNLTSSGGYETRVLVKFPGLSALGLKKVTSAQLALTMTAWRPTGAVLGYYLNRPWDKSVTWKGGMATLNWLVAGASGDGSDRIAGKQVTIPATSGGVKQTVTLNLDPTIVQAWIQNEASNQGILLVCPKGTQMYLESPTAGNLDTRPKLLISLQ